MQAIDDLVHEHHAVVQALAVLDQVAASLGRDGSQAEADLAELLDFFTGFVDRCHHAKEEEVLFPELERVIQEPRKESIGVMLAEHEAGRTHVRAIAELLQRLLSGDASAVAEITQQANAYRQLLSSHIDKENTVLFAMAERLIPADAGERIAAQFERIEQERVGAGRHAQYHEMLRRLKASYRS